MVDRVLPSRKHAKPSSQSGSEASKRTKKGPPPSIHVGNKSPSTLTTTPVSPIPPVRQYAGINLFMEDLPVGTLDPFTIGAHVNKCVHEKLFPHCKFFKNNGDIDQFVGFVFTEIGINKPTVEDSGKRKQLWYAVRSTIKKRTNDNRQLCVDRWYIAAKSKFTCCVLCKFETPTTLTIRFFSFFDRLDVSLW